MASEDRLIFYEQADKWDYVRKRWPELIPHLREFKALGIRIRVDLYERKHKDITGKV